MIAALPGSTIPGDLGISTEELYRLTVEQYHAIAAAAILEEDDPVELLEGLLVCKYGPFEGRGFRIPSPPDASPEAEDADLTLAWIWRLRVKQYHAMIEAGILTEDDPVELLGGWLVRKMTQKPAHPITVDLVRDAFADRLSGSWYVRTQAPLTLSDGEPEPDLALVRGDRRDFLQQHPGAKDVALVVEVADTSLARDRGVKQQLYAAAGIPVYWIVNLSERRIEVYNDPASRARQPRYRHRRDYGPSEQVPLVLDGTEVAALDVGDLLP